MINKRSSVFAKCFAKIVQIWDDISWQTNVFQNFAISKEGVYLIQGGGGIFIFLVIFFRKGANFAQICNHLDFKDSNKKENEFR
jgi:hypothetical protein